MAFKSNSILTLSMMIVIASTFSHAFTLIDNRKLLNSFENVLNTLDPSLSNGDWQLIKDPKDPKVVDIAKFAVNRENIISPDVQLRLESVLNGRFRVENNGTTYELTIVAIDFDEESEYKTMVFENYKDNVRKLISITWIKRKVNAFTLSDSQVITFTKFVANNDRKLLDSFDRESNTLSLSPSLDDWEHVRDTNDPKGIDIAEFTVNAENKKIKSNAYEFLQVTDGKYKIVNDDIIYSLDIVGTKFDELDDFTVVVYKNPGDWTPLNDVNTPYVVAIGQFAVNEHNKETGTKLEFQSIIKGESQVVAGTNYRLVINAKDGGHVRKYLVVVWDKPWEKIKKLTSFKQM
ncbi:hypothetical protein H5410_054556 [Solanum commersonii]|uniref:Cystatin domain-containing protein n=1 Tax=Solanum commersonii TaxID=4109 RepID=A0A9J5WHU5_SOLCO|nr:hypothetical protein H5410_054556 [Solanum commersonii]